MSDARTQKLKIVSLLGEQMDTEIYGIILPSKAGRVEILPDHEPFVTLLKPGPVAIRLKKDDPDEKLEFFALDGGVVKAENNTVVVLADEAESARDIAEQEAREAYERAKRAVAESHDDLELAEARRLVQHQAARLRVAELRRRHHKS